jgi:hypothetical protein
MGFAALNPFHDLYDLSAKSALAGLLAREAIEALAQ